MKTGRNERQAEIKRQKQGQKKRHTKRETVRWVKTHRLRDKTQTQI